MIIAVRSSIARHSRKKRPRDRPLAPALPRVASSAASEPKSRVGTSV